MPLHKNKNFRLMKISEKDRKDDIFVCFRFTEISYFLSFPSNENVRKEHLSANAYFCVNLNFSYTIAVRKMSFSIFLRKQVIFHEPLGQLLVDDI